MLRASTDFKTLAKASEKCLQSLHFSFVTNRTLEVVEYEITQPCYFRVVLEPRKDPKVRNLFLPSITPPSGSTVDIRYDLDADEQSLALAEQSSRNFLRALVSSLPEEPWKSLGFREQGREKRRWQEML